MTPVPKRRYLSASEKLIVIRRQSNRCVCGCRETLEIGAIDFDHALPLHLGGTNDLENFRALKKRHHMKKSGKETAARAKVTRIQAQGGLLKKKLSAREKLMAKVLGQ